MKKVERLLKFNIVTCNDYIKSGVAFHSSSNRLHCTTALRLSNMGKRKPQPKRIHKESGSTLKKNPTTIAIPTSFRRTCRIPPNKRLFKRLLTYTSESLQNHSESLAKNPSPLSLLLFLPLPLLLSHFKGKIKE